jgi:hypothetical protein
MTQAIITERDAARARYVDTTVARAEMARKRQSAEYQRKIMAARRRYAIQPEPRWKTRLITFAVFVRAVVREWKRVMR